MDFLSAFWQQYRFTILRWLGFFACYMTILHLVSDAPIIHRIGLLVFLIYPIYRLFPKWLRWFQQGSYYTKVATGFIAFSLLIKVLPGGYFPPFYGGICGWTLQVKENKPIGLSGLKLVRKDGEEIWFSPALTSPQNFTYRLLSYWDKQGASKRALCLDYFFDLYTYQYPYLAKGHYAQERVLGKFAYPGHNPSPMFPYVDFPPESIRGLIFVSQTYTPKTHALIKHKQRYFYNVHEKRYE